MERWSLEGTPKTPGVYAVTLCYDPTEGFIPSAAFWDGEKWDNENVAAYHSHPFKSKEAATTWAYANDIEL